MHRVTFRQGSASPPGAGSDAGEGDQGDGRPVMLISCLSWACDHTRPANPRTFQGGLSTFFHQVGPKVSTHQTKGTRWVYVVNTMKQISVTSAQELLSRQAHGNVRFFDVFCTFVFASSWSLCFSSTSFYPCSSLGLPLSTLTWSVSQIILKARPRP